VWDRLRSSDASGLETGGRRADLSGGRADDALLCALEEAQNLGFLGPGPVAAQVAHSRAFAAFAPHPPGRAVDLGSGGGLPGLVLASGWPQSRWILLDASRRRTEFLERAVDTLHLAPRVEVRCQRAEVTGRDPALRGQADLVVARSFGSPAVVAECAAPLLRPGGHVIVAEPPGGDHTRWPTVGLALVGLQLDGTTTQPWALQRLIQTTACPDRYPRRTGIPDKRPLFKLPPTRN
jgi:16S rRNA (guanine527-N7)-methyltransferase